MPPSSLFSTISGGKCQVLSEMLLLQNYYLENYVQEDFEGSDHPLVSELESL